MQTVTDHGPLPTLPPNSRPEVEASSGLELAIVGLAVFLAPFNTLRHPAIYITLSDCVFVLALGLILFRGRLPAAPLGLATLAWFLGTCALVGGLLLSSVFVGSPLRGMIISVQYLFAYILLPLVILGRPLHEIISLIKIFLLSMVLISWFGIALYFMGFEAGYDKSYRFVSGAGRMASFIEKPNAAAGLIALTMPLVLYLWLSRNLRTLPSAIATATLGVAIMLTGSNTGLGAMLLGILAFTLLHMSVRVAAALALVGFAMFFVVSEWGTEIMPAPFAKRVMPAIESGEIEDAGTFKYRLALMKEAVVLGESTLLLGFGADQYKEISEYRAPVHNTYLLLLAEGGLLSLAGWLLVITSASLTGVVRRNKASQVAAVSLTSVFVFAMIALATPHMYARFWVIPLLLALGLSTAFGGGDPGTADRRSRPSERGE